MLLAIFISKTGSLDMGIIISYMNSITKYEYEDELILKDKFVFLLSSKRCS